MICQVKIFDMGKEVFSSHCNCPRPSIAVESINNGDHTIGEHGWNAMTFAFDDFDLDFYNLAWKHFREKQIDWPITCAIQCRDDAWEMACDVVGISFGGPFELTVRPNSCRYVSVQTVV